MKKHQKVLATMLAVLSLGSMVGCGDSGQSGGTDWDIVIDSTKVQLFISNYNGGFGDAWLKAAVQRFEAAYAEEEFSNGKKGVQIVPDNAKVTGTTAMSSILSSRDHVFFLEDVSYTEYVAQGLMLDITDMVTEDLTAYGEIESIEDKLSATQKSSLQINGKYYAIPHYDGYTGITVDVDLMDSKNLFLGSDGEFMYKSTQTASLSKGPDDIAGTYDDGLPATYDEFFELCTQMKLRGVDPISWSGQYQWYVSRLLASLYVDDMGLEEAKLSYTFDGGETEVITSIAADGSYTTENKTISIDKGYEVFKQPGYYNALRFIETIIDNGWYTNNSFVGGFSNIDVQDDFLLSSKEPTMKPIGMLIEGNYWESEATATFNEMEEGYSNAGKMDRRLRFMPLPKSSDSKVGSGSTLVEGLSAYGFVRGNIEETEGKEMKDLAVAFLQFVNTDVSLREFNVITNTPKGLSYDMTDADLAKCSYFGRSIYELKNAETSQVLHPPLSAIWSQNRTTFSDINRYSYGLYTNPSSAFYDNKTTLTAAGYFNGLAESWKGRWSNSFSKYFN